MLGLRIEAHCSADSDCPSCYVPFEQPVWYERTYTKVDWNALPHWVADTEYETPNLACILEELRSVRGFQSGNDITFFVINNGSSGGGGGIYRVAYDYSQDTTKAAKLKIWWHYELVEEPSGGVEVGGSATVSHTINPSGGVEVGGNGHVVGSITMPADGGVDVGGLADVWSGFRHIPQDGVEVGGNAIQVHSIRGDGGVDVGGSVTPVMVYNVTGEGGVILGRASWPNGYLYRTTITVPAGEVGSDLTKFYLGVTLPLEPETVVTGTDFLVTDDSDNELDFELREWDGARLWIYIKTDLKADVDNIYYLYSGRSA